MESPSRSVNSDVFVRFSHRTPWWPLSVSYSIFMDPSTRIWFVSLDNYLAYHMLARHYDRERVCGAPNGYLAWINLEEILKMSTEADGEGPVVRPTWEQDRDAILDEGLRLKYSQNSTTLEMLLRTDDRRILDVSRDMPANNVDATGIKHWCHCNGSGDNAHGKALMRLRNHVLGGGILSPNALPAQDYCK